MRENLMLKFIDFCFKLFVLELTVLVVNQQCFFLLHVHVCAIFF